MPDYEFLKKKLASKDCQWCKDPGTATTTGNYKGDTISLCDNHKSGLDNELRASSDYDAHKAECNKCSPVSKCKTGSEIANQMLYSRRNRYYKR